MGNLVFSNAILDQANISPAELRLAVAVYLYIEKRLNLNQAQLLSGLDLPAFQKEAKDQSTETGGFEWTAFDHADRNPGTNLRKYWPGNTR